jgi:taurine dioxygenase
LTEVLDGLAAASANGSGFLPSSDAPPQRPADTMEIRSMYAEAGSIVRSDHPEIIPYDAAIGAEVRGVDLSKPLDDAVFARIEAAYDRHTVLVFRNQNLTPDQHIAFGRRFGPLEVHVLKRYLLPDYPEILVVSNVVRENGEFIGLPDAGQTWHTDTSYRTRPSRGSILHALEIPLDGNGRAVGETLFAGTGPAYDALSPEMKARIDGRRAIHRYSVRKRPEGSQRAKLTKAQIDETPDIAHPVVRTHPNTGRKSLYVFEGECVGIEGMPDEEGRDIIRELTEHCIQPQFIYRHQWQVGDVVMWDNVASLHLAISDYRLPQRRLLHRVTVEGGIPV